MQTAPARLFPLLLAPLCEELLAEVVTLQQRRRLPHLMDDRVDVWIQCLSLDACAAFRFSFELAFLRHLYHRHSLVNSLWSHFHLVDQFIHSKTVEGRSSYERAAMWKEG